MSRILTASDRRRLIRLASTMTAGSPERKAVLAGLLKSAKSMDRMEYFDWLQNLAVGDVIEVYWTAGSGGHYHGKARIKKVNRKSVVAELMEEVETWSGGTPYPVGNPIRVPTTPWDRRFGEFFNAPMPLGVDVITRPKRTASDKLTPDSLLKYMRESGDSVTVRDLNYAFPDAGGSNAISAMIKRLVKDGKLVKENKGYALAK